uniref:hypothetical protein n=1 Tax=Salmonella sp. s51944 TaxID=3159655 RepID=UPI003980C4C9
MKIERVCSKESDYRDLYFGHVVEKLIQVLSGHNVGLFGFVTTSPTFMWTSPTSGRPYFLGGLFL